VGTDKRARQKELHRSRLEAAKAAEQARERRTRFVRFGLIGLVAVGLVVLVNVFAGGGDEEVSSDSSTTTTAAEATTTSAGQLVPAALKGPGAGSSILGETPCPKADGSSARTTSFEKPPPMCIDESKTYTATFETSKGTFTATLDAKAAPQTVNNFVVLARYHFYDGIPFHRIVPNFVIQAGDPSDTPNGQGGPGYSIGEEPPADKKYEKYDLAMAKTQAPSSTGSQFFVVTGDPAALDASPTYSLFGHVTDGTAVVDAIGTSPVAGDSPTEQITIQKVTIAEK